MIIHIIIRKIVERYGKNVIGSRQLLNILNDLSAFNFEVPALRNALGILLDAYGVKIINAFANNLPGSVTLNQFVHEVCENYGMKEDIVKYLFDSLGYGIGWIDYIGTNVINNEVIQDNNKKLSCNALLYHYMGFNVYDIRGNSHDGYSSWYEENGIYNYGRCPVDSYKHPTAESEKLKDEHKTIKSLLSIDRTNSTGLGCFTGYNDIVAIDIDFIDKFSNSSDRVFKEVCVHNYLRVLGLPSDYQWVISSISGNGLHIIVKIKDAIKLDLVSSALTPTRKTFENFKRVEVIWKKNIALPPTEGRSIFEQDPTNYQFFNCNTIATCEPSYLTIDRINNFLDYYCGCTYWDSFNLNGKYLNLYYMGKQSTHRDSMGGYTWLYDDKKWVQYCTSENGKIAYAVQLAKQMKLYEAYEIFRSYNSDFANFNAAALILYGAVKVDKNTAKIHLNRIDKDKNYGGLYSYHLKELFKLIEN